MIAMYLNKITSACREIKRPKMNLDELIAHYVLPLVRYRVYLPAAIVPSYTVLFGDQLYCGGIVSDGVMDRDELGKYRVVRIAVRETQESQN
jgi:hypothetical protein